MSDSPENEVADEYEVSDESEVSGLAASGVELDLLPYRGPDDDPEPRPGGFLASVALILRPTPGLAFADPELLVIRRARFEGDPWSGQMALPGGRREEADRSLLHTALRETREETALSLDEAGSALGRLEVLAPENPHLPTFSVVPFVFRVPELTPARPASREVSEVLWIPLSELRSAERSVTHRFERGGQELTFPAVDYEGRIIWGLTYLILQDFFGRLR